jgi:mono/diheme cytochrome c family protein
MPMKTAILRLTALSLCSIISALAADKVDFKKDIQPILEKSCIKCHGPEKQKGKLRLDLKAEALKGTNIVPGDPEKSELVRRIGLPAGDDDIMPNEGDPLTKEQIELLTNWVKQGAVWPDDAAGVASKPATTPVSNRPADIKPSANELKAIQAIAKIGVDVRPIAMNVNWREANFRPQGTNITDAAIAPLKDVLSLVDLNLASTRITDGGLAALKNLIWLERLHLEQTGITDKGLVHLKGLTNLTYLNLYGTPVTDAGLENLKGLKNLNNLYVWQTKVTTNGIASLKQSLPQLQVVSGLELNLIAKKDEEKKDEKKEEKK